VSLWFRIQEYVVEVGLRLAKVVVATLFGLLVYLALTGLFGVAPTAQLALESWIAGALVLLLVETGIF
jgi:ABC-type multidrug transport system permease subunit